MNVSEPPVGYVTPIARKLRARRHWDARIKVDDRAADQIFKKWIDMLAVNVCETSLLAFESSHQRSGTEKGCRSPVITVRDFAET